jgi:hypothetical protein
MDHIKVDFDSDFVKASLVLVLIARLYFSYTRVYGWTLKTIQLARELFQVWRKFSIGYDGFNSSILEHAVGAAHLMDDVIRHGPHDVYWCYQFEREVSSYMQTAKNTNSYLYDVTFTLYRARTLFTETMKRIDEDRDGLYPVARALTKLHGHMFKTKTCSHVIARSSHCLDWHKFCAIKVNSQIAALQFWKNEVQAIPHNYECKQTILQKGIIIGPKRLKKLLLNRLDKQYLIRQWVELGVEQRPKPLDKYIYPFGAIVLNGNLYRINNTVVVRSNTDTPWKGIIKNFFISVVGNHVEMFFQAYYFDPIVHRGTNDPVLHPYSKMTLVKKKSKVYNGDNIRAVSDILHKFILLPALGNEDWKRQHHQIAYELEDIAPRE